MSELLFKNVKRVFVRTIPADIPPLESSPDEMTLEDAFANQALQRLIWQPPKTKEGREALIKIIKKGKIKHFITGRGKQQ